MWPTLLLLLVVAATPDGEAGTISSRDEMGDTLDHSQVWVTPRAAHALLRSRRQAWDPREPTFWRLHQHFLHLGQYEAVFEMDAAFWALHASDPEASRRHYLDRPDPEMDRDPEAEPEPGRDPDRDPEPGRDPDPESERDYGNREPGFAYPGRGRAPHGRRDDEEEEEEERGRGGRGRATQRLQHGDYGDY